MWLCSISKCCTMQSCVNYLQFIFYLLWLYICEGHASFTFALHIFHMFFELDSVRLPLLDRSQSLYTFLSNGNDVKCFLISCCSQSAADHCFLTAVPLSEYNGNLLIFFNQPTGQLQDWIDRNTHTLAGHISHMCILFVYLAVCLKSCISTLQGAALFS